MLRIFNFIIAFSILCFNVVAQAATVTDARWGVNAQEVLRLVVTVDKPTTYNVRLEGNSLRVLVNADVAAKAGGTWNIRSNVANSMTLKKEGSLAVLQLPLVKNLTADNYDTFVLRKDPQGKPSYRIVVDVDSKKAAKPVVSSQPVKKATNSGNATASSSSWTDRFKKPGATAEPKLTPSERVKRSIEQAKQAAREKQQAQQTPVVEAAKPSTAPVDKASTSEAKPINNSATAAKPVEKPATQPSVKATATTQGDLKRILNAKRLARREAAAEAAEKKKNKDKEKTKEITTSKKEDGVVYIKGTGKFKTSGGLKDKVITLDAGHGGSDPGAVGLAGTMEKNLTLPVTKKVAELLTKAGAKVHMTRVADKDVHGPYATDKQELQARVNVAEKYSSDLFISVHINSSVNRSIRGVSCYYHPKTSHDARIAKLIQNRLVAVTGMNNMNIREAGFYVIKRNSMPATLLELGFISNKQEEALMRSAAYQEKAARAIFEGIKQYFG